MDREGGHFIHYKTNSNMAQKITICGKELKLAYSLHAAVSYEKMTGKSALDLSQFQDNQLSPVVELGYCMLIGCNPAENVPQLEDMLRDFDTMEKMTGFVQAVSAELIAFYQPDKSADQQPSEDAAKNE